MSDRYVFSIAGCNLSSDACAKERLPTVVDITFVPVVSWDLWHAAFARDSLVGLWWYAPATEAIPALEAAIERMRDPALAPLADARRGLKGNRLVVERMLSALRRYDDNVIAVGAE